MEGELRLVLAVFNEPDHVEWNVLVLPELATLSHLLKLSDISKIFDFQTTRFRMLISSEENS